MNYEQVANADAVGPSVTAKPMAAPVKPSANKLGPKLELTSDALQSLIVVPVSMAAMPELHKRIGELGGHIARTYGLKDGFPRLGIKLPGTSILALAESPQIKWIENNAPRRLLNNVAAGTQCMNVENVRTLHNLTGRGQVITTTDTGIDTGNMQTMHPDFRTNLIGFGEGYPGYVYLSDTDGHGTHTAGSIVGDGTASDGLIRGIAYEAKLWSWFCNGKGEYYGAILAPDDWQDVFCPEALGSTNAYIHSASWGSDFLVYNTWSQSLDWWCFFHPDFLPVFAAGNAGNGTVCCEAAAKNVLAVGATENLRPEYGTNSDNPNELAYFSSTGPMPDGRIKPDICAPGTYILSTRSSQAKSVGVAAYDQYYMFESGTSMATPLVAGSMALIRQWLTEQRGYDKVPPTAALMKAIITGGAKPLGDAIPNSQFGFGGVDLNQTLYPVGENATPLNILLRDRIPFSQNSSVEYEFEVTTDNEPLIVQLCWIDYPAEPDPYNAAAPTLVNDLDLIVSNRTTGATWSIDDHINNLERIEIDNATSGEYAVIVRGTSVPHPSSEGGAAAIYMRGAVTSADEPEKEYVTVTLNASGGGINDCLPSTGRHLVEKGQSITIRAAEIDYDYWAPPGLYGVTLPDSAYEFIGWRVNNADEFFSFDTEITLQPTEDTTVTCCWQATPSQVSLLLCWYDDYAQQPAFDGESYGAYYMLDYGETVEVDWSDSPFSEYPEYALTSFYWFDKYGNNDYIWGDPPLYRTPDSVTFTMETCYELDIGFAYKADVHPNYNLPYVWWMQNFAGAYYNYLLDDSDVSADGDADGDGFTNAQELNDADGTTDPRDANSFPFRFTATAADTLTFIGGKTVPFVLQTCDDLKNGEWTKVTDAQITRDGIINTVTLPAASPDSPAASLKLYRIAVENP